MHAAVVCPTSAGARGYVLSGSACTCVWVFSCHWPSRHASRQLSLNRNCCLLFRSYARKMNHARHERPIKNQLSTTRCRMSMTTSVASQPNCRRSNGHYAAGGTPGDTNHHQLSAQRDRSPIRGRHGRLRKSTSSAGNLACCRVQIRLDVLFFNP